MEELDDFYQGYGQQLIDRLVNLAGSAFVFVEDLGDPKEIMAATGRGDGDNGQLLVWEQFAEDLDTGGRDNFHSKIEGSVVILSKGTDRPGIRLAYANGRKRVLDVLALMVADAQDGPLDQKGIAVEVRKFPLEKVQVGAGWYGCGLLFTWLVPLDLTLDPAQVVAD